MGYPASPFPINVSVSELMKDLGFLVGFRGEQGAMMLEHPDRIKGGVLAVQRFENYGTMTWMYWPPN